MKQKYFLALAILGIILVSGCIGEKQTVFTATSEAGDNGIARLRYDQNLTINLISDTEFEVVYTVKSNENLKNESVEIILPKELIPENKENVAWTGDLNPGEVLTLKSIISKETQVISGEFKVQGMVKFEYPTIQVEHTDLYVIVEGGKIVDVQKPDVSAPMSSEVETSQAEGTPV